MNTKILFGVLAVIALLAAGSFFLSGSAAPATAPTRDEATSAVIALHPELASYKTTSLPPSFIEAKEAPNGWYIAFIQRGSGLPGILNAQCYHVNSTQEVTATGQYTRHDNVEADMVALEDCNPSNIPVPQTTPVVNNPSGKCYIGGCSAQLCTDQQDAVSTCEYTAIYACYKSAKCERQVNGQCGWTQTPQLAACLRN